MAQLAVPLAVISGGAQIIGGFQKKKAMDEEALEFERRAGESRATSQREAIDERRQARISANRAQAVGAASGSAGSPDLINRIADIEGEGELNFLRALYEGNTASDRDLRQADVTRKAGKRQLISSILGGASTAASGFALAGGGPAESTTMLQKYE